ncbi:PQQ-binding-like beta-propeller repeat protein [Streptomyces sp. SP17BM10]|uniref:outer membrane protein assembly factor BamB family protein n=1 Tax=Streptomyces sp. SP17BM10 TaxID=3002530 RepID=UPI002E791820|nr:PQQ-binding-like beta-propeller repeat protein [Streptomyces sp. SP17BM10]MEE1783369.1 PQQ-binding-like beta-propeller repeat protein [Streptomyces sp. SP17BM10]
MAQEPFGDAQQQAWYPQQQDWQGGHPEQQHGQQTHHAQQGHWQTHWQTTTGYGQGGYGQGDYGQVAGYGEYGHGTGYGQDGQTAYGQGGYAQDPYQPHQPHQPYQSYHPYPGYEQQQYAEYAEHSEYAASEPQQPAEDGLYVPAGAEYSADGYVHLESTEPEPAPAAPGEPQSQAAAEPVVSSRSASRRGGDGGGKGASGVKGAKGGGTSLADRARAAADAVLTGEHVPSRKALMVRTGAGVAALGVLIAAGLMVGVEGSGSASTAGGGGGEPGFTVAHTKAWSVQPVAAAQPGADDTLVGSWLLADAVVRADASGVRAYDLAAGKPGWSVEPPATGAVPCGLSPTVNPSGVGAVLFRAQADPNSPCTLLAAVDTKTGKTAWTKTLSDAKGAYAAHVGVTDDKIVAVGDDRAVAWDAADGKDVWQYTGQGKFCTLSGGVTGKTVMVASTCADSTPAGQAVALNTADGKVSWWRGLNNNPKTVTVLSAEPAVVLTTGEKPADDRVFAWGANGDPAAEIPVGSDTGRLDVAHGTFSATPGVFFQDRTMVTTLVPANGAGAVVAVGYDLDSGKQSWKAPAAEKGVLRAVALDGGSLVLAADERRDQPAHLSRFAVTGGHESTGGNFPPGTGSLLISGRVLIGGGKVVVVPEHSANFGTAAGYQAKG